MERLPAEVRRVVSAQYDGETSELILAAESDEPTDMVPLGCERVATTEEAGGLGGMRDQASPEFAPHLWHDNPIYGLRLEIGDPDAGDWRSDLVLDIDHVVAWACGTAGGAPFLVAPATLTFHHAGDLRIAIDCGDTGGQVALHELAIDRITRERVRDQRVCLDRPYYRWRIDLNRPRGGLIGFAASGFTQVLRAAPVPSDAPGLPAAYRRCGSGGHRCG